MNYRVIIASLLCVLLLCSPVYAGNGHGNGHAYEKQFTEAVGNTTIKMSDGIDGSRYEVKKNNRHIRIELKEEKIASETETKGRASSCDPATSCMETKRTKKEGRKGSCYNCKRTYTHDKQ